MTAHVDLAVDSSSCVSIYNLGTGPQIILQQCMLVVGVVD